MKKFLALALLLSCAASTPAQAGIWEWLFGKKEEPKMTSYEATLKLWEITQVNKFKPEEYEKEFARLVALGASVDRSPYPDNVGTLLDHAIEFSNVGAVNFLIKTDKPSHGAFEQRLVGALIMAGVVFIKEKAYENLALKPVKSFISYGAKPSQTHERWIKEEQASAAETCKKSTKDEEKEQACKKSANLAKLMEVIKVKPVACESVAIKSIEDKK